MPDRHPENGRFIAPIRDARETDAALTAGLNEGHAERVANQTPAGHVVAPVAAAPSVPDALASLLEQATPTGR